MRRQGQYPDLSVNPLVAGQMQQHHTFQNNPASSKQSGRHDALSCADEHKYISSNAEGQWHWDQDGHRGMNPLPAHVYKDGPRDDGMRSLYQGQRTEPKLSSEKQGIKDSRVQLHEKDSDVSYEECPPQTREDLEYRFVDEIMKLVKEHQEAEDAEIAYHKDRITQINSQYQEKLIAARAPQSSHRDEFLRRESQTRQHQYQQLSLNHYSNSMGSSDMLGYGPPASRAPCHFDSSYKERSHYVTGSRGQGFESSGTYAARTYEANSRYY